MYIATDKYLQRIAKAATIQAAKQKYKSRYGDNLYYIFTSTELKNAFNRPEGL